MTKNIEMLSEFKARKEAHAASNQEMARAKRYSEKITEVRAEYKKLTGREYGTDGYFVFRYEIYEGWIDDLDEPENWRVDSVAVDEQGNQFKAVGPDGAAWAEEWKPISWGGAGEPEKDKRSEKPEKVPEKEAAPETFRLDPATKAVLIELAVRLGRTQDDILKMAVNDMGVKYDILDESF